MIRTAPLPFWGNSELPAFPSGKPGKKTQEWKGTMYGGNLGTGECQQHTGTIFVRSSYRAGEKLHLLQSQQDLTIRTSNSACIQQVQIKCQIILTLDVLHLLHLER